MLKNYFKIAIRNLAKQKALAIINIFGLSVGIACFCLFMLYAVNEFNYDNFHKNGNGIYRVFLWSQAKEGDKAHGDSYHPMPLGPALKKDLPGVADYVRLREAWRESFVKTDDKVLREEMSFADPSFFSIFSFKLISGSADKALQQLNSLVLTESTADLIFGKANPIGKIVQVKVEDRFEPFIVTAVAEDPPSNSSIRFRMLGNFNFLATTKSGSKRINNWHQYSYQTYVQLKPGSNLPHDINTLIAFRKKYYPDEEAKSRENGWKGKGPRIIFGLESLATMHTDTRINGGIVSPIDPQKIWILLGIAAAVLFIACINFTTLSIGRSAGRSVEVGVRKVIGGTKKDLVIQFLTEAMLMAMISAMIGLLLAYFLMPLFNGLSGIKLDFSINRFPQLQWLISVVVIVTGLFAGSYPALVLSGFKPVEVLKTKIRLSGSKYFHENAGHGSVCHFHRPGYFYYYNRTAISLYAIKISGIQ